MSGAFQYKPKFVDIRVRPPREDEEDVTVLKPGERRCDHAGCLSPATAKAPKSRERLQDHYWFCQAHAAEYNKSWNFFAGMNEGEIERERVQSATTGDRPTWQFRASKYSREAAAFAANAGTGKGYADPLGIFRASRKREPAPGEETRHLGRLERNALADLDLAETASATDIRTRYTELIKRCHPDTNGGDRSAEHKLQRVLKAYKTLRHAKLV
jgi:hypothetical protein